MRRDDTSRKLAAQQDAGGFKSSLSKQEILVHETRQQRPLIAETVAATEVVVIEEV